MSVFAKYDARLEAEVQMAEQFWVRLRSHLHPAMKRLVEDQRRRYRSQLSGPGPIPAEVQEKIDIEKAAAAIVGWRGDGAVDREGRPMPYSSEAALALVSDPDMQHFRLDVIMASHSLAPFAKAELAELGKSSSASSAPTSSGPTGES